jgi:crotonobetainyl-CoA:carnitine CoA-transferase CaiB-like acyl-CoA transferase
MCDTSIVNAQLLNTSYVVSTSDGRGFDRPRIDGMQLGFSATHRLYECEQGWLCLVLVTEDDWRRFAVAVGLDVAARLDDEKLAQVLEHKFRGRPAAEWLELLDAAGVPCEVSDPNFALQLHDDPEMVRRGWVVSYRHPFVGKLDQIGVPYDFSETSARVQGPPLVVGQHSRDILRELGYSPEQIDELCADCVLEWVPGKGHRQVRSPWQPATPAAKGD